MNVLQVMQGLGAAVDELLSGRIRRSGLDMQQVYDETVYIDSAIRLLCGNLGLGILLAVAMCGCSCAGCAPRSSCCWRCPPA